MSWPRPESRGATALESYSEAPVGLLASGPLIARFGYPATATLYGPVGIAFTLVIAVRWRTHIWRRDAPANKR